MWRVGGKTLSSRLLLGTALYPSNDIMQDAIVASDCNIITVSLRRQMQVGAIVNPFWESLKKLNCSLLPNTAGCVTAQEAVMVAEMAREIFKTNWIKLEVIGDDYNLQPDPFELVDAAKILVERGFEVFPYCTDDLVLCQRLLDIGCRILMPWAAPIGTGKGIINPYALEVLRSRLPDTTLIIDAGIGKASDAAKAMEMGFDGVLLNTAVAQAQDPVQMARAFRDAVTAGRYAFEAGIVVERSVAKPSTTLVDTPFWHQQEEEIKKPIVWTIAGSDSAGLAGLQADLKTFSTLGVHGCSILTAVTAQNRQVLAATGVVLAEQVTTQLSLLKADLPAKIIKIGMLGSVDIVEVVKQFLSGFAGKVVLDPVLISSSGNPLYDNDSEYYLSQLKSLFPYVDVFTPNLLEAETILNKPIQSCADMEQAANQLLELGLKSVFIKGGHQLDNKFSQDYWTNGKKSFWLTSVRQPKSYRGTGCTLASAVAAALALDYPSEDAVVIAKMLINQAMRLSDDVLLGYSGWPEAEVDLPYLSREPLTSEPIAFAFCHTIGLYPIVDSAEWVKKLALLGVKTLQLRIKNKTRDDTEFEIKQAIAIAREYHMQLFINDYWELAIKYHAYGVHLGQEDLLTADISQIRAAGILLGISTHSYEEIARAHTLRPSYIALGPIYPTTSKVMIYSPQGIKQLQRWRKMLSYPLVAIGGINLQNIPAVLRAGVDGVALISAIIKAADPTAMTLRLLEALNREEERRYVA